MPLRRDRIEEGVKYSTYAEEIWGEKQDAMITLNGGAVSKG